MYAWWGSVFVYLVSGLLSASVCVCVCERLCMWALLAVSINLMDRTAAHSPSLDISDVRYSALSSLVSRRLNILRSHYTNKAIEEAFDPWMDQHTTAFDVQNGSTLCFESDKPESRYGKCFTHVLTHINLPSSLGPVFHIGHKVLSHKVLSQPKGVTVTILPWISAGVQRSHRAGQHMARDRCRSHPGRAGRQQCLWQFGS